MKQVGTQSGHGSGKVSSGKPGSMRSVPNKAECPWAVAPIVREKFIDEQSIKKLSNGHKCCLLTVRSVDFFFMSSLNSFNIVK